MSFYATLRSATEPDRHRLFGTPQIVAGLEGRITLSTYLAYLSQAYHHVRHTVPLLRLARDGLQPTHERFREALDAYIEEEAGHEQWILRDIAAAGGDAQAVRDSAPGAETAAMVSYAYDYVRRVNPMGLFGMVFVLEDTSAALAGAGADKLGRSLGLGPECFSYLASHGSLDQDHLGFFAGLMDKVTAPVDREAILQVAHEVYRLFADLFRSIPHQDGLHHAS